MLYVSLPRVTIPSESGLGPFRRSSMTSKNAATHQDVIENSVYHQIFALANSADSPAQMETLPASGLGHDLIACPRQSLETYLNSDSTGRVPLDAEHLQI